jgi:hypothetical protein
VRRSDCISTGLLVFLGLSHWQLDVTALGLRPVGSASAACFSKKTRKNPVKRSTRWTAAHYAKNRMMNRERPKRKLRMESSVRLILSPLISTSVPNRTLWCHPKASSGVLGSTAGHQRSASHGVLHDVSGQRQEMVSCLHGLRVREAKRLQWRCTVWLGPMVCRCLQSTLSMSAPGDGDTYKYTHIILLCVLLKNCP